MRRITIVGAGQAGLMVGIGLVKKGYAVTLVSNRTPEEIRNGRVTSGQGMQSIPLLHERELGLRFWEDISPPMDGGQFNVLNPEDGRARLTFSKRMGPQNGCPDLLFETIDQRVKMPAWMYRFQELGGNLCYEEADVQSLERYCDESDLVIVAAGKGEIGSLFARDDEKSTLDKPMRGLGLAYVKGMGPIKTRDHGEFQRGMSWNAHPGVGEYFTGRGLTINGECDIMTFEAIPGGPMDILDTREGPEKYFANCLKILDQFFPEQAERCKYAELTDDLGILSGRYAPAIRKPIGHLPGGGLAMGIADTVCLNDPITGQGSCNAAKSAKIVYDRVLERAYEPFDQDWMQETFDIYWAKAKYVVDLTNAFLVEPTAAQAVLLEAASENQPVADLLFTGLDDARRLYPYFNDESAARDLIARLSKQTAGKAA